MGTRPRAGGMNMNIQIVALGLMLVAQTGLAQESYKPAKAKAAERAAMLETLYKGKEYPHLQTVFYLAKAGTDIADALAALQADARIESAYPEIIEYVRVPK